MANPQGAFIWYELLTPDMAAARRFYQAVVGWTINESTDMPGMDYRMIVAPDGLVGGMMELNADMLANGAHPVWLAYIAVEDVDATVADAVARGGQVHLPPRDIPDVGRFAMLADPQGAPFYVMRGLSDEESGAFDYQGLGHCSWNELSTPDQNAAHDFYEGLFGWTNPESMSMGDMGDYRFLDIGGTRIGATTPRPGEAAGWRYYFRVSSVSVASAAVNAGGGSILMDPQEVPGGDFIILGTDPQGAAFALVGGA